MLVFIANGRNVLHMNRFFINKQIYIISLSFFVLQGFAHLLGQLKSDSTLSVNFCLLICQFVRVCHHLVIVSFVLFVS